jgi:hypothetical protein
LNSIVNGMGNVILEFIHLLVEDEFSKLGVKNQVVRVDPNSEMGKDVTDDVFQMIQKSYDKIGGHAKIRKPGDIGSTYPVWDLADVDKDPEPDVARLSTKSNTTGGLKGGAVATDGSPEAKSYLMNFLSDFYNTPGNWGEVSGAMANILIKKLGFKPVENEETVRKLLGNKEIVWHGDTNPEGSSFGVSGWYSRKIGDHDHVKIIVGNV